MYYPLLLDLNGVKCLVVGGGEVASRKVLSLAACGADVTVISPEAAGALSEMVREQKITFLNRKYQSGDVKGFRFIFVAAGTPGVSGQVAREAQMEGAFINVADEPELGNFIVPSKIQRGDLTIAISTNGKSPMLSKKIRLELEEKYGPEYGEFLELLGRERDRALKNIKDISVRRIYFHKLVHSELLSLIKNGNKNKLDKRVEEIWREVTEHNCS